jgi:hypothetical protein
VALSLTRGRVYRLLLLLALASAVILGSESRGTRDHISLSHIRDFPFHRLLRLPGLRLRYSTPPPHGTCLISQSRSQSYVTTNGQSTSLSRNKAPIWGLRPYLYYCRTVARLLMWGALSRSLTRGRVCRLPESQSTVISMFSVCTIYILHVIKCMHIQHIQGLCQPTRSTADQALSLVILLQQQSSHLNGRMLDRRQV